MIAVSWLYCCFFVLTHIVAKPTSKQRKSLLPLLSHDLQLTHDQSTEDKTLTANVKQEGGKGHGHGYLYSQRELSEAGWCWEKKRDLSWVKQVEYSGETFFDG
jgi:hypothetical protein